MGFWENNQKQNTEDESQMMYIKSATTRCVRCLVCLHEGVQRVDLFAVNTFIPFDYFIIWLGMFLHATKKIMKSFT